DPERSALMRQEHLEAILPVAPQQDAGARASRFVDRHTISDSGAGRRLISEGARAGERGGRHILESFVIMNRALSKPRIFLGSSGKQAKLIRAITRGLEDVADVEPWMTTFSPGQSTLDRLVELSREVDFAAFVFAQDDWTTTDASEGSQASPRDNVVFEAGLFGGALGIRRT